MVAILSLERIESRLLKKEARERKCRLLFHRSRYKFLRVCYPHALESFLEASNRATRLSREGRSPRPSSKPFAVIRRDANECGIHLLGNRLNTKRSSLRCR